MPITKSAKKALTNSRNKRVFNDRRKSAVKTAVKEFQTLVGEGKKSEAAQKLSGVFKAIDKAAKGNTIKKNTASRKKSRLSKLVSEK